MWIYYSYQTRDIPMIVRSAAELSLLSASSVYIVRNKIRAQRQVAPQAALPS
jgi:hypothetical protein